MELENNSDVRIFVSHVPPKEGAATNFLSYTLERKSSQSENFVQYGEGFHTVPNLYPVSSRGSVTFRLIYYPSEVGEYRVRVGYYDDEDVYKMISTRLLDMTDGERKRADEERKYVFSDSFFVPPLKGKR